jgi:hypothetical protein
MYYNSVYCCLQVPELSVQQYQERCKLEANWSTLLDCRNTDEQEVGFR